MNMNKRTIYLSVVLSTYNDEKYIKESIQSILDQTYPYFEFIIVNDGSTDCTLDIIKSFTDERIVLIDKPNTGLIDSLNIGVRAAKYDWIARMDGDDIAEPNRFDEEVKLLNDSVAIVSSQCNVIDSTGKIIGHTKFLAGIVGKYMSLLLDLPLIVHPSVVFNKVIFKNVGGYDPNMNIAEDYDLWCKMLSLGKLIISPQRLLNLRKHESNISITKRELQILNNCIGFAKKTHHIYRNLSRKEYNYVCLYIQKSWLYNRYYSKPERSKIDYLLKHIARYCDMYLNQCIRQTLKKIRNHEHIN